MSKIFRTNFSDFSNHSEVYSLLLNFIKAIKIGYITLNNVFSVVESVSKEKYREALNNSTIAVIDSQALSQYLLLFKSVNSARIFGPTFMEKTLEWGQKDELKHYFFGSSQETLNRMNTRVKENYPNAVISGSFSPPYKKEFSIEESDNYIQMMNESGADIFWIGLGAPKQEIWMYENYKKLNKGIMIGVGAGFDYLAGNTQHAPKWMKDFALEWLYRLMQEPKRLWKRYLVTNTLFLWYVLLEFLHLKKFEDEN